MDKILWFLDVEDLGSKRFYDLDELKAPLILTKLLLHY